VHGSAEKPIQVHLDASRTGRRSENLTRITRTTQTRSEPQEHRRPTADASVFRVQRRFGTWCHSERRPQAGGEESHSSRPRGPSTGRMAIPRLRPAASARNDQGAYRSRSQKEQGPHRPRRQPLMQPERVRVIRVIRVRSCIHFPPGHHLGSAVRRSGLSPSPLGCPRATRLTGSATIDDRGWQATPATVRHGQRQR